MSGVGWVHDWTRAVEHRRHRLAVDGACEVMARFCAWWYLELAASVECFEWSDMPTVTDMDREIVLGRAIREGVLRLDWRRP